MIAQVRSILPSAILVLSTSVAFGQATPAEAVVSAVAGSDSAPVSVITMEVPVVTVEKPSFPPSGVTLATIIELDAPDPLALTVPMPPLAINPGTTLTLRPSTTTWSSLENVRWFKNGESIAVANGSPPHSLVLPSVTNLDSGSYRATFTGDGEDAGTVFAHVLVHPGLNHPLTNISTRATIGPENPQVIVGFSIPQKIEAEYRPKKLLVRAIGESLQDYGVNNPLPDPTLRIFDADGNDVSPAQIFITVVYDDGTTPRSRYYESVASAANSVGAFPVPVPGPESPLVSEYSELAELPPGAYTIVVTSAGGQSGDVLVEVYEVGL